MRNAKQFLWFARGSAVVSLLALGAVASAETETTTTTTTVKTTKHAKSRVKDQAGPPRGDNTAKNADDAPTADSQNNDKKDVDLTAEIRRSVVSDKTLSISAHNVKIIAKSGVVTLKGPVKSTEERVSVVKKAELIAGATHVRNELDVAP